MSWHTVVTSVELAFPLLKQFEGGSAVADFVAQIVGDAAVGVDIEKMLTKPARKEPACDGKIFVVRSSHARRRPRAADFGWPVESFKFSAQSRNPSNTGSVVRVPLRAHGSGDRQG